MTRRICACKHSIAVVLLLLAVSTEKWCAVSAAFVSTSSSSNIVSKPFERQSLKEITGTRECALMMIQRSTKGNRAGGGRIGGGGMAVERSKRQFRVGQVVRSEVASIIRAGHEIKHTSSQLDGDLRNRISVVAADVSPDLRQARITISVMSKQPGSGPSGLVGDATVEKRVAFSWLVKNTKQIKHALAQRLKHMKSVPNLTFAQADVGAAVDVMQKIDGIFDGANRIRSDYGGLGSPEDLFASLEEDDEYDDWDDIDDDDDFEFLDDDDDDDDDEE